MSTFDALREQLLDAAAAFSGGGDALAGILSGMVDDVDRMLREELEIFPVCHHSPASALAMTRRLRDKRPKVVYLELCEDLRPLLDELRNCRLPVALQAFATQLDGFPPGSGPLSVIAPVTEASAEYQAIAYALDTPGVEIVLVDRSVDHVFQWLPQETADSADSADSAGSVPEEAGSAEDGHGDEAALHGDAVGVEIGDLRPRFAELEKVSRLSSVTRYSRSPKRSDARRISPSERCRCAKTSIGSPSTSSTRSSNGAPGAVSRASASSRVIMPLFLPRPAR